MLLDKFTSEVRKGFAAHGVREEDVKIAIELDLDISGSFGESWLALDMEKRLLYRLSVASDAETAEARRRKREKAGKGRKHKADEEAVGAGIFKAASFEALKLDEIDRMYIDSYASSNRLLAVIINQTGENCKENAENGKTTFIIASSTNARKKKLFAFVDVIERLRQADNVTEDDPIFEQFFMKCPKCGKVYSDQNRQICESCVNTGAMLKRLLAYFGKFKPQLAAIVLCMIATSAVSLVTPVLNGFVLYDMVVSENGKYHTEQWVYIVVGAIFMLALISVAISIIQNRCNAHMSSRVTLTMKLDIFNALQKLSLSYFNQTQTGRLINRVNYDADRIRSFFIDGVPHLIVNGLNFIGLTVFLFCVNWKLTLIVFVPVPIIVCIFKFMLPKLWRANTHLWQRKSDFNGSIGDSLNGIRVIKAFSKEAEENQRFYKYGERLCQSVIDANLVHITIFPVVGLLIGLSSKAIWGFGGMQVMGHFMTYGAFTTYFGYLTMIFGPLNFFTNFTNLVTETMNSAQRMFEIIDAVPEITDSPDAVEKESFNGDIEFRRVCFHYAPNRPVLKNMTLTIKGGSHIGLVGHTGAGKSTIANLICRMYDTISGSIFIDGINVRNIKSSSLRHNIAVVSQEIFIFKGTIAENIKYARPSATMDEVIEAAKSANAHDFILRLPDGYETVVGTGNRSLSGGERQRISIARALLLSPSILILDEATAAMDTETERLIQAALERVIQGRTTITIAHRLSTLKDCEYLYAIEDGEIAEEGTHTELMEKKGLYYKLYTLQSEAMKKVIAGM